MALNPYSSQRTPAGLNDGDAAAAPPGLRGSTWLAAKRGTRIAAFCGGALSLVLIIPAFALAAFGLGSGGGWALPKFFFSGVYVFLFVTALGAVMGAGIGFVVGLIRKVAQATGRST